MWCVLFMTYAMHAYRSVSTIGYGSVSILKFTPQTKSRFGSPVCTRQGLPCASKRQFTTALQLLLLRNETALFCIMWILVPCGSFIDGWPLCFISEPGSRDVPASTPRFWALEGRVRAWPGHSAWPTHTSWDQVLHLHTGNALKQSCIWAKKK